MWPVPDKVKDNHMMYRLAETKIISDKMATGFEAMGYISSQSLIAPLDHHWYQIYMHLFNKYFSKEAKEMDFQDVELGIMETQMLERFQRWMFKKQIEHIKSKEKEALKGRVEKVKQKVLEIKYEN